MKPESFVDKVVYKCKYFFVVRENYENRKTPIYFVFDNNAVCIAQIKWYSAWRKFCLYPDGAGTIWDKKCLTEIVEVIDNITAAYRAETFMKRNLEESK